MATDLQDIDLYEPESDEIPKAPFPWFGGKSLCVDIVWPRFGAVGNYVEPFFGSGAMLLGRPQPFIGNETINDKDGFVANLWRSIRLSPEETADWADNPVNECDLHARHVWLLERREELADRLCGDPDYHDPRIAGYWVWGQCCWIGSGWCSGEGPWWIDEERKLVKRAGNNGKGVNRPRVHLGDNGRGVNRKLVHLGDNGRGVNRKLVHLGNDGRGVNRPRVHLGNDGRGIQDWFAKLASRLRHVRVCCGDWSRVCGSSVTFKHGVTGVFLDPPYADTAGRNADLYSNDSLTVAHDVREWAIANGDNPLLRIALCGYEGEHVMPESWECVAWKANGGYGGGMGKRGDENRHKERIWFSPHCLRLDAANSDRQQSLFVEEESA